MRGANDPNIITSIIDPRSSSNSSCRWLMDNRLRDMEACKDILKVTLEHRKWWEGVLLEWRLRSHEEWVEEIINGEGNKVPGK